MKGKDQLRTTFSFLYTQPSPPRQMKLQYEIERCAGYFFPPLGFLTCAHFTLLPRLERCTKCFTGIKTPQFFANHAHLMFRLSFA